MPALATAPELFLTRSDLAAGCVDGLFVGFWRARPTMESVQELTRLFGRMSERYPRGYTVMVIIEDGVPIPNEAIRRAITQSMESFITHIRATAGVQEAKGFLGAMVLSTMIAMSLLVRTKMPRRFFGTIDEAAKWLAPLTRDGAGRPWSAQEIVAIVAELRRAVRGPLQVGLPAH